MEYSSTCISSKKILLDFDLILESREAMEIVGCAQIASNENELQVQLLLKWNDNNL